MTYKTVGCLQLLIKQLDIKVFPGLLCIKKLCLFKTILTIWSSSIRSLSD